jgi:hypothetical protein
VQLKFLGGSQLAGDNLAQFFAHMNRMRALSVTGSDNAMASAEPRHRLSRRA